MSSTTQQTAARIWRENSGILKWISGAAAALCLLLVSKGVTDWLDYPARQAKLEARIEQLTEREERHHEAVIEALGEIKAAQKANSANITSIQLQAERTVARMAALESRIP